MTIAPLTPTELGRPTRDDESDDALTLIAHILVEWTESDGLIFDSSNIQPTDR